MKGSWKTGHSLDAQFYLEVLLQPPELEACYRLSEHGLAGVGSEHGLAEVGSEQ